MSDSKEIIERAFRLAVAAFAQYAEGTNEPSQEALDGFAEGFLQQARAELTVSEGGCGLHETR